MPIKPTLLSDWLVFREGGFSPSVDVVVSGGEITLSVVVRFGILRVVPSTKMLKS